MRREGWWLVLDHADADRVEIRTPLVVVALLVVTFVVLAVALVIG